MTLLFYVDDIVIFYPKKHEHLADLFEKRLTAKYDIRKLVELEYFLGVRILRDRPNRKLWILQDSYIDKLQKRFNITIIKAPRAPIPAGLTAYDGKATTEQIFAFQQRTGSLNWPAVITRPDIARAVSKLCQFQLNPSPDHIRAAEQALRYLISTKYYAIEYDGRIPENQIFMTFSDAAFADDDINRWSSCGYALKLFGGVVGYKATKQRTVTTASTHAELLALSMTAKEYVWWLRLFKHIGFHLDQKPTIYCDNTATIRLLTKEEPKLVTALKHVDIHQSWLRQEVQNGTFPVKWLPTADMVADGLTKELPPQKHQDFLKQLGLVDIASRVVERTSN